MRFASTRAQTVGTPLAPLLDVVLLLLIFFVVTSSFAQRSLEVELPTSESGTAGTNDSLVLTLDAGGGATIAEIPIEADELPRRLERASRAGQPIELRAHRATKHEAVVRVLDLAQQAGIASIGVVVSNSGGSALGSATENRGVTEPPQADLR